MEVFWDEIIYPLILALKPKVIVEVGAEYGVNSEKILAYCNEYKAVLHIIDPAPLFDVKKWNKKYGELLVIHMETSLTAIPNIEQIDCILLDGDHNWYTVFNELNLIEQICKQGSLPVIFLHDMEWPYARRDLYYDPASIPVEYRQEFARKGLALGSDKLLDRGGLNWDLSNAIQANTPKNGVRTALEDFLSSTESSWNVQYIPGFHGLAIVSPVDTIKENEGFRRGLNELSMSPIIFSYIQRLEQERLDWKITYRNLKQQFNLPLRQWIRILRGRGK